MADPWAEGAAPESTTQSDRTDQSMDVMVVEDDPFVRYATCELLREEGYAVVAVACPSEALERLRRLPQMRTVLVDIHLGLGLSGIALAARIRHTHPACRILLTSGGEPPELAFDGFVAKPFSTERLLAAFHSAGAYPGQSQPFHDGVDESERNLEGKAGLQFVEGAQLEGAEYRG